MNEEKTILDLCGGTGSWSKPYRDNGYTVFVVDSDPATEPDILTRVQDFRASAEVWGILCAPPCTEFAVSGARWWKSKLPSLLEEAIDTARACLKVVEDSQPKWWALENPVGRIKRCVPELGEWKHIFHPYEYGDPWMKKTCLWGNFEPPEKNLVSLTGDPSKDQRHWYMPPSPERAKLRSITPPGFAKAFYEANP